MKTINNRLIRSCALTFNPFSEGRGRRIERRMLINWLLMASSLLISVNSNAAESPSNDDTNRTVIEEKAPKIADTKVEYLKEKSDDQTPSSAGLLFHIPGLTLTQTGGPLESAQIRYHGLSNARLPIDIEGLALGNPIHGILDANSLFLFAAEKLAADANSLSISLPKVDRPHAKAILGYGSHNTFKLGTSAGTPIGPHASIFAAMQAASTNGRFAYTSPDLAPRDRQNFYRENNDQNRIEALVKYEWSTTVRSHHALVLFNAHEGGVAGFGFSPTPDLRQRALFGGMKLGMKERVKNAEFSVDIANSVFDYRTTDKPNVLDNITASIHEISFGMKPTHLPQWLDLGLVQKIIVERAYQLDKTRIGGGFYMYRNARFLGKLKPTILSSMTLIGYGQQGVLRNHDLSVSIDPVSFMTLTGGVKYHSRLPTFMEMYANNRFFAGNAALNNESIWDLELAANFRIGQHSRLFASGFIGFIGDIIVYVPELSRLKPINTGVARRHGVDLGFTSEPFNWLMVESKNSILMSKIKATNAPLPQTPHFMGMTKVRFGTENFLSLTLQSRYRGPATANIYGTLRTNPYVLLDAILAAQIYERIGLSLSVSNIFNVKSARDTYEMPLPGIAFFGQIAIGHVS